MKFIILAVLGTIFLGGCTGSKDDTATDTSSATTAE
jgi:PBP1b-binding outer membrane lipoprotein LpoB